MNGSDHLNHDKGRKRRRGWISSKSFEELYEITATGCWLWIGSLHSQWGFPVWKGRENARHVALCKAGRPHNTDTHKLHGTTCGEAKCIAPDHAMDIQAAQTSILM